MNVIKGNIFSSLCVQEQTKEDHKKEQKKMEKEFEKEEERMKEKHKKEELQVLEVNYHIVCFYLQGKIFHEL